MEEAIEEADFVISLLEGHEIDGPVAYDWEMHDSTYRVYGHHAGDGHACAVAFCERIEEAGYGRHGLRRQYVSYIKYDQALWSRISPGTPSTRARAPSFCTPPCTITWTTGSIPASALWPVSAATWM